MWDALVNVLMPSTLNAYLHKKTNKKKVLTFSFAVVLSWTKRGQKWCALINICTDNKSNSVAVVSVTQKCLTWFKSQTFSFKMFHCRREIHCKRLPWLHFFISFQQSFWTLSIVLQVLSVVLRNVILMLVCLSFVAWRWSHLVWL